MLVILFNEEGSEQGRDILSELVNGMLIDEMCVTRLTEDDNRLRGGLREIFIDQQREKISKNQFRTEKQIVFSPPKIETDSTEKIWVMFVDLLIKLFEKTNNGVLQCRVSSNDCSGQNHFRNDLICIRWKIWSDGACHYVQQSFISSTLPKRRTTTWRLINQLRKETCTAEDRFHRDGPVLVSLLHSFITGSFGCFAHTLPSSILGLLKIRLQTTSEWSTIDRSSVVLWPFSHQRKKQISIRSFVIWSKPKPCQVWHHHLVCYHHVRYRVPNAEHLSDKSCWIERFEHKLVFSTAVSIVIHD